MRIFWFKVVFCVLLAGAGLGVCAVGMDFSQINARLENITGSLLADPTQLDPAMAGQLRDIRQKQNEYRMSMLGEFGLGLEAMLKGNDSIAAGYLGRAADCDYVYELGVELVGQWPGDFVSGADLVCDDCGGTGAADCRYCSASGYVLCTRCRGFGHVGADGDVCDDCGGTGVAACGHCGGAGLVDCVSCEAGAGGNVMNAERTARIERALKIVNLLRAGFVDIYSPDGLECSPVVLRP